MNKNYLKFSVSDYYNKYDDIMKNYPQFKGHVLLNNDNMLSHSSFELSNKVKNILFINGYKIKILHKNMWCQQICICQNDDKRFEFKYTEIFISMFDDFYNLVVYPFDSDNIIYVCDQEDGLLECLKDIL